MDLNIPDVEVVCVDRSPNSLSTLNKRFDLWKIPSSKRPIVLRGDINDVDFMSSLGKFDYIHCDGVLMHQMNVSKFLRALRSLLRDDTSILKLFVYADI
jgi:hypothetical protein